MIDTGENAPAQLRTRVCIVGSGPAGMTVALELERLGIDCVLLESGLREPDRAHTALNQTRQVGLTTDHNSVNRLRGLGGTSAHWGGLVRPLDALDFEARNWVPGSGWPLSRDELAPHYATAHRLLKLPATDYDLEAQENPGTPRAVPLADRDFENIAFVHDTEPVRMGQAYGEHLADSGRITTLLDATVTDLETDPGGQRVTRVQATSLSGRRFAVVADRFVLAAGAIQSARLLLNANRVHAQGLGNSRDQVGRYFLQHPVFYGTRLLLFDTAQRRRLRRGGRAMHAIRTAIRPDSARARKLLNFHVFPLREQPPGRREQWLRQVPGFVRAPLQHASFMQVGEVGVVPQYLDDLRAVLGPGPRAEAVYAPLEIRAEQAPNPDSRITLDETRDALGVRRAVMDWRLGELDQYSLQEGARLFGGCVARNGLGRLQAGPRQTQLPQVQDAFLHGGNHHYGTTRMGHSPANSVVDRNCRLHEVHNLYVAGSAVFPTTGHANPTLTIVALAARLAQHLAGRG